MNTKFLTSLLGASVLVLSLNASAQSLNPFIGTWDLNAEESIFGSAPIPQNIVRTYEDRGGNTYFFIITSVNSDGGRARNSATYKYDELEYPLSGLNQESPATISYKRINDRTIEYTIRNSGTISQIGAKTISMDARRLTIAIQITDAEGELNNQVLVFNKRQ
jgi:hypothetical protein